MPTDPLFPTPKGSFYTTASYRTAIGRAAERAGVAHWHPHQLRHARPEQIDGAFGREATAAVLGDTLGVTQIQTARNAKLSIQVAKKMG
jgi:integrase